MISFYDTLKGKIEEFKSLHSGEVRMYACGPTVYDFAHIGNFRTFMFEDLLRRFLEASGFKVHHVMNITDVDDKTIAGSQREMTTLQDFTEKYTQAFHDDLKTLNILFPHEQPRATVEIPKMLELIQKLMDLGIAYVNDGSVYYRVSEFPEYGKLSKKNLGKNIVGARVDVDEYDKEQGADFVLWKKSKAGEPAWDSPWGKGRPGWHIECSAMSMRYLGETIDIHAGGEDLIFPHHENEIAQSEAVTHKPFVRYWLHAKHLMVNAEKMSKSKGNFYTLRDLLAKGYDPMAIRYSLLATHYRLPLNFTLEGLKDAAEVIKKMDDAFFQCYSRFYVQSGEQVQEDYDFSSAPYSFKEVMTNLGDDLNVAAALGTIFDFLSVINKEVHLFGKKALQQSFDFFQKIDRLFGLNVVFSENPTVDFLQLVKARSEVRNSPDFKTNRQRQMDSDRLRVEIDKMGWLIKDGKPGEISIFKKKRRVWDK